MLSFLTLVSAMVAVAGANSLSPFAKRANLSSSTSTLSSTSLVLTPSSLSMATDSLSSTTSSLLQDLATLTLLSSSSSGLSSSSSYSLSIYSSSDSAQASATLALNVPTLSPNSSGSRSLKSPVPTSTINSICMACCTNNWPKITTWVWITASTDISDLWSGTATVTATVVLMVDDSINQTQTSTVINGGERTSWQTAITATQWNGSPVLRGGAPVVLTFPSEYVDYDSSYSLQYASCTSNPTLPSDASSTYILTAHPPMHQPAPPPVSVMPGEVWGLGAIEGTGRDEANGFFKDQFPLEAIFQSCCPYHLGGEDDPPAPSALASVEALTTTTETSIIRKPAARSTKGTTTADTSAQTSNSPGSGGAPSPEATDPQADPTQSFTNRESTGPLGSTATISETPAAAHTVSSTTVVVIGTGAEVTTATLLPAPDNGPNSSPNSPVYNVNGQTLSVGGSVTLDVGSTSTAVLALATDGSGHTVLVVNGQTSSLALSAASVPILVLFGTTITSSTPSPTFQGFITAGQTLTVGGTITLGSGPSATTLTLTTDSSGHTVLVSNGHTSTLPVTATASTTGGVTSVVESSFGSKGVSEKNLLLISLAVSVMSGILFEILC